MAGAREVRAFEVLCPAGTLKTNPQITNIAMPTRTVYGIRVRIPPGPNGVMGFAIGATGTNIIPINSTGYIVGSDEILEWELPNQINSGAWQAIMYNLGRFDHTIYITFVVELPDLPDAGSGVQPIVITGPAVPSGIILPSGAIPAAPTLGGS